MTLEMLYRDNATTILGKHFRNLLDSEVLEQTAPA
jgi:hypothetical protein